MHSESKHFDLKVFVVPVTQVFARVAIFIELSLTPSTLYPLLPSYLYMYLVHVELAHIRISDRSEIWAWDLYHSTVLFEAAKSLALSNIIGRGKVPYQKPQLKSMGACCISAPRRT